MAAPPRPAAPARRANVSSGRRLVYCVILLAASLQWPAATAALKVRPAGEQARQSLPAGEVLSFDDEPLLARPADGLEAEELLQARADDDEDFLDRYRQLRGRLQARQREQESSSSSSAPRGEERATIQQQQQRVGDGRRAQEGRKSVPLSPVILIPGYGGSRLEGKRNKAQVKHYFCEKVSDWSNIWIDLKLMLPYMIDCLIEDFRLEFDYTTNATHNTQGVDIRVRDPDDVSNVEFLTDIHLSTLGYFAPIIRRLTTALGYERNHNIRGAPYDFRKAPNELGEFFAKLKRDTEQLSGQFESQRVTYICHSMGCNNILYFLQRQPQTWKDQYVFRLISLAAPWGGSMQAVRATVFGDNLGLPYLFDEAELKVVQKSVPSTMYLFPKERAFQKSPLISFNGSHNRTKTRETLTAADFKRFFEKIQHPSGYLMWLNTRDLLGSLEAPQVEVWCLYGHGRATLGRMEFQGDFPDSQEVQVHDDGDGTVTVQSSTFCRQWSGRPVHARAFPVGHVDVLRDAEVLDQIEAILAQVQLND